MSATQTINVAEPDPEGSRLRAVDWPSRDVYTPKASSAVPRAELFRKSVLDTFREMAVGEVDAVSLLRRLGRNFRGLPMAALAELISRGGVRPLTRTMGGKPRLIYSKRQFTQTAWRIALRGQPKPKAAPRSQKPRTCRWDRRNSPDNLSRREQQVLDGLLEDLTNRQLADRLKIRERGVKFHVSNLLLQFGVRRRCEVVTVYRKRVEARTAHRGAQTLNGSSLNSCAEVDELPRYSEQPAASEQGKAEAATRDKNAFGAADCGESSRGGTRAVSSAAGSVS
jgi:DNA-binding CsgD family transcriptional regulator